MSIWNRWDSLLASTSSSAESLSFRWPKRSFGRTESLVQTACKKIVWKRPGDGQQVLVRVDLHCPSCGFPLSAHPGPDAMLTDDNGQFDYNKVISCGAWWPEVQNGISTGRRIKCNWSGVVRDGWAHDVNCPAAAGRNRLAACVCGCNLTQEQIRDLSK